MLSEAIADAMVQIIITFSNGRGPRLAGTTDGNEGSTYSNRNSLYGGFNITFQSDIIRSTI